MKEVEILTFAQHTYHFLLITFHFLTMSNKAIAKVLKLTADLLEIKGESPFKISAYQRAARGIETLGEPVEEFARKGLLGEIQGVGTSTKQAIKDILETGTFPELDSLQKSIPDGVQKMLNIKGVGPKKVQFFWINMGLESLGELYYACVENRLAGEKGFGAKTQESIKAAIEFLQSNAGKFLYGKIFPYAENLLTKFQNAFPDKQISFTGQIRRKAEIIDCIEFIIEKGESKEDDIIYFFRKHLDIFEENLTDNRFVFKDSEKGIQLVCYFASHFAQELFQTTANAEHLSKLGNRAAEGKTEEEIYANYGLPYIEPELREGLDEIDRAKAGTIPQLITEQDIKGVVHNHSTYSDGANTLKDMAVAAQKMGYEYLVISDHSQSAFYANGLSEGRIEAQHVEIDKLNKSLAPFKIFKSIESDILKDGSLDYEEKVLKSFDLVIASVHSILGMDEETATNRLIKAIENPYTRILGHPTGRLLLSRKGYPIDHKKMIDACAANGVAIEINANPYRLDLDWRWIPYALEKGVLISINPDAHSIEGIGDIRYGVAAARKGMLFKEMCLNAKNLGEFENWLRR